MARKLTPKRVVHAVLVLVWSTVIACVGLGAVIWIGINILAAIAGSPWRLSVGSAVFWGTAIGAPAVAVSLGHTVADSVRKARWKRLTCDCDGTGEQNGLVCRVCWGSGDRENVYDLEAESP